MNRGGVLQGCGDIPQKSVRLSHQNSSVTSNFKTPVDPYHIDPNESECIASCLLPYTLSRDSKDAISSCFKEALELLETTLRPIKLSKVSAKIKKGE